MYRSKIVDKVGDMFPSAVINEDAGLNTPGFLTNRIHSWNEICQINDFAQHASYFRNKHWRLNITLN